MDKIDCPICCVGFWRTSEGFDELMNRVEKSIIEAALTECGGNQTQAARELQIEVHGIRYLIKKHGLNEKKS